MTINGKNVNLGELVGIVSVLVSAVLSVGYLYADQRTIKANQAKLETKVGAISKVIVEQTKNTKDIEHIREQMMRQIIILERIEQRQLRGK